MSKTHIEIVSDRGDIEYKGNILITLALAKKGVVEQNVFVLLILSYQNQSKNCVLENTTIQSVFNIKYHFQDTFIKEYHIIISN